MAGGYGMHEVWIVSNGQSLRQTDLVFFDRDEAEDMADRFNKERHRESSSWEVWDMNTAQRATLNHSEEDIAKNADQNRSIESRQSRR
jgi:hypothetical protein